MSTSGTPAGCSWCGVRASAVRAWRRSAVQGAPLRTAGACAVPAKCFSAVFPQRLASPKRLPATAPPPPGRAHATAKSRARPRLPAQERMHAPARRKGLPCRAMRFKGGLLRPPAKALFYPAMPGAKAGPASMLVLAAGRLGTGAVAFVAAPYAFAPVTMLMHLEGAF